jgi:hypothetical protein
VIDSEAGLAAAITRDRAAEKRIGFAPIPALLVPDARA